MYGARALWSRLGQVASTGADAYNAALVQFNLARCAKLCKDQRQSREATVAAVRLLEEAADHFESVGQRERAFDCFQVLVQIGRESNMFEDVLEGYVNCIRILREDHLKYFALQYFEDALGAAREKGELSAAATLAREASDYARALGMPASAAHYTIVQAELWRDVARQHIERGAPAEIAENALLAAILANPDDNLPRLVLADWLQEHGEDERAELIRIECEMARSPDRAACDRCRKEWSRRLFSSYPVEMGWCDNCRTKGPFWPDVERSLALRRRRQYRPH